MPHSLERCSDGAQIAAQEYCHLALLSLIFQGHKRRDGKCTVENKGEENDGQEAVARSIQLDRT